MNSPGKTSAVAEMPLAVRERVQENCHIVEIAPKFGMPDAAGSSLLAQLPAIGVPGVREIRVSALYEIAGSLTSGQVHQAARELLSDPITQEYRVGSSTPSPAFLLGPHWRVEVWLKPSVTDPVGESVCKALADMGLPRPSRVRTGAGYRILGRLGRAHVDRILLSLLANPVIHRADVTQL